ncbi:MAG: glycerol-3-phosphate ABC transporter permease [Chloroflexota bacterium]|jgi:ABC-type glycerol-3-phosphate transport system permease component|nr:carbohydrate ABC transporter permease [Caldilinea sp.]GIK71431.1 MAG: glycerol-3-phosphate ABC transporter permease [Chloroflexota bacterium]
MTHTLNHLLIILAATAIGFPFFYMIASSLKTIGEVYSIPMVLLPAQPQWSNFAEVWRVVPFPRFTFNSVVYTVGITLGEFFMGMTAGFAFARLRFPKRELLFFIVLLTFMIPGQITLIPRFILLKELGWINTYQGLIVPELSSAFALFLLREHFRSLPDELFDAAKMDGAGYLRQLLQVAMPLSKPITATLLLLASVAHWNAYLWPLIVTNSQSMRTLPIGIQGIKSAFDFPQWHLIMAGATIVVLPLVILFMFAQKQFIEGATQGALKG